jgi:hypothetical protein
MNKYRFFLSILIIVIFSAFSLHKYYVSVSESEYNESKRRIEVSLKVFSDDFENALDKELGKPVYLGGKNEYEKIDSLINSYLSTRFYFEVNKVKLQNHFIGSEIEGDATWLYFYTDTIASLPNIIFVYNNVLTELFEEQRNVVQVKVGSKIKSSLFTKSKAGKEFEF